MAPLLPTTSSDEKPFPIDIGGCITKFLKGDDRNRGRNPQTRDASFDYCFNYFQSFQERNNVTALASQEYLVLSCLHLGWYLANWGMLRGSFLLQGSVRMFEPLIAGIASFDPRIWAIDVERYDAETIEILLACKAMIRDTLHDGARMPTDTLATKIMLGVFGNVPAFDQFFKAAFGVGAMNAKSLLRIRQFYDRHKDEIDGQRIRTLDIATGEETHRPYTKAKIIDMIGFIAGLKGA